MSNEVTSRNSSKLRSKRRQNKRKNKDVNRHSSIPKSLKKNYDSCSGTESDDDEQPARNRPVRYCKPRTSGLDSDSSVERHEKAGAAAIKTRR